MSKNLFDLSGRSAVLSGASGGLGRVMAHGLADAGADVVIVGRDLAALVRCRDELVGNGARVELVTADLTDHDSVFLIIGSVVASSPMMTTEPRLQSLSRRIEMSVDFPEDAIPSHMISIHFMLTEV
jgi:NAD(P)-dependent dehydrogenase (short-subunit alcohol dehydrogenase family)